MLEAQPLIVEQAATSRLGVQFVENAVEHRLIADHTPHTLPSTGLATNGIVGSP